MAEHPETEVLHRGEGARAGATPLTTPIYATSTFVFANAAELEAYQQGESDKYIYSRYANPTVQAVEEKLAALEGAEAALVTSSGMAATATALFGLLQAGRRGRLQRGDLRRHAAAHRRSSWRSSGVNARFASLEDLAQPESVLIGPKTQVRLVRVADQSDAALRGHPPVADGLPRARRDLDRSTTRSRARQSAAAGARRRSGHALGDEVPERPQRRHRRRARRQSRRSSIGCSRRASCSAACSSRRRPTRWRAA